MITKLQYYNNLRIKRTSKNRKKALLKCPQRKGMCIKVFKMAPKKPNSAKRTVLKVQLTTKKIVHVHTPGECFQDNLQQYSWVLIRGGRVKDLPGIQYRAIRNKFDFHGIVERKSSRSKYGTKDWSKNKLI
jgi:small subunit ribosomal protein S12